MKKDLEIREDSKKHIKGLYDSLMARPEKDSHLLNITDVLKEVYGKIDKDKNPTDLLTRLVKYIYIEGFSRISLSKTEEADLIALGDISKRGGSATIAYNGNFSDKSQFYSLFERVPQR